VNGPYRTPGAGPRDLLAEAIELAAGPKRAQMTLGLALHEERDPLDAAVANASPIVLRLVDVVRQQRDEIAALRDEVQSLRRLLLPLEDR
jgi:hypothetical protein